MGLTTLALELTGWLYLVQLALQLFQLAVRAVSGDPCHKAIIFVHTLIGVTGTTLRLGGWLHRSAEKWTLNLVLT
jgi:hypothetical protein